MYSIEQLFEKASADVLCNTSYPLSKDWFAEYRSDKDIMADVHALSFYFHIPFCKHLCSFCEYTRFLLRDASEGMHYIQLLQEQTDVFLASHQIDLLLGLDVGGGTPTALGTEAFEQLMKLIGGVIRKLKKAPDFESSLEFSFSTYDTRKIELAVRAGIERCSTGIQVYDQALLQSNQRDSCSVDYMISAYADMKQSGIRKLNLDIMYGLPNETTEILLHTLRALDRIHPEQITLYETRYNCNAIRKKQISRDLLFSQYELIYNELIRMGYKGRFGQNTFSLGDDEGVSSYLASRMFDGKPYKGFGVSAQSMSRHGISYNNFKSERSQYMPTLEHLCEEDNYSLPAEEIAAKYICIALYSGRFDLNVVSEMLGQDAEKKFEKEIRFLFARKLITIQNHVCLLTPGGFRLYGAVGALFWSEKHKSMYLRETKGD